MLKLHDQYLAGFFDGEGCITSCYSRLMVTLVQSTHSDCVLHAVKQAYGGGLTFINGCTRWQAYSHEAAKFLKAVLPYLIVKKLQAEAGLRLYEHRGTPYVKMSEDQKIKRGVAEEQLRELKGVGCNVSFA